MAIKLYIKYVKEILDGIRISEGESLRTECPACNGSNTFTVTKSNGRLLWNCYRASCAIKGVSDDPNPSHSDLVSRANYRNNINTPSTKKIKSEVEFSIPTSFSFQLPDIAIEYLRTNNCYEAWSLGIAEIAWDVLKERVVFLIKKDGVVVDAVGRQLGSATSAAPNKQKSTPKWLRYNRNSDEPFLIRTDNNVAYLVEDAASACAVSKYGSGFALLGTSLTPRCLEIAKEFRAVVVCLDKDATSKGLALTRRLRQFTQATLKILHDDPKVNPRGVL